MRFLILFLTLLIAVSAEIIETDDILSLSKFVDDKTVLLLDLDNTVMRPKTQVGSAQHIWFDTLKLSEEEGIAIDEAKGRVEKEWGELQKDLQMIPTDPFLPDWISRMQKRKVMIFGITRRSPELEAVTRKQLKSIGVKFPQGCILFCGNCPDKSVPVRRFLQGLVFEKIIFIDDVKSNVEDMESFAETLEVEYLGVRYSRCDAFVEAFDLK